jgi:geranylgeranyl diphosphate synthase type I
VTPAAHDHDRQSMIGAALLDRLRGEIEAALALYLDEAMPRLAGLHPALAPLADELRAYVAGGKRLRPLFVLLGFRAAGGVRDDHVMGAALSLELLHTCALLHDDVIDGATHRRGRPATHTGFAEFHRSSNMHGSPEEYGHAVAILLGDLAFTLADDAFLRCEIKPERFMAGFRVFTTLREEVMAGQFLDVQAAARRARLRETVLTVATLKSGRYSVTRPLELGAVLAGADETMVAGLHAFGDPLGRAFQVRDDILGVFGEQAWTGKSVSSDLAEGKRTLLVAEALDRLDAHGRAELESLLGRADLDAPGADRARELLRDSGGLDAAQLYVASSTADARAALAALAVQDDEAKVTLGHLADLLAGRQH